MDWNNQKIDYAPCSYDITNILRVNGLYALPFHGNRLVEGWQLSGIVSSYGGYPFNVATGFDQLEQLGGVPRPLYLPNNPASGAYPACNNQPMLRTLSLWYNPNCYGLEPVGASFGHIYGIVDAEDSRTLVLTLIEGHAPADRIRADPLPLDEALAISKRIIEGMQSIRRRSRHIAPISRFG